MTIDAHAHAYPEVRGRTKGGETRSIGYGKMSMGGKPDGRVLPPHAIQTKSTPEMLIEYMDWGGVDRTMLLQGPFYGQCNWYASEAIKRYPDRLFGAAFLDPWSPGWRSQFEEAVEELGFRAVKLELSEATGLVGLHPDLRMDDPDVAWLWAELERRKFTLTLDLGAVGAPSYQTRAVRGIIEQHPDLRIIIAHLCQPNPSVDQDAGRLALGKEQVSLSQAPNVWMDTAALPAYLDAEGYPCPSARHYLLMAVDLVGPDKIMWGTDVPGLLLAATDRQLVTAGWAHSDFLSHEDQVKIMGGNAMWVFGAYKGIG